MKLLRPLMPHQLRALEFCEEHPNPFLAMAMRTGKTLTAIRYARRKYPGGKFLVVAPLTVLIPWAKELDNEALKAQALLVGDKAVLVSEKRPGWYLVGPAALKVNSYLLREDWDMLIVDESTVIRNPAAQITQYLNHHIVSAKERMCLSGWPCPESEMDWFEQLRFLHGSFMGCKNYYQWRRKYFVNFGYVWHPRPGTSTAIKQALQGKVFFLSAKEAGMPNAFVEELRYVKMYKEQKEIYEQVEKDFAATYSGKHMSTKWVPVRDLRLHQIASGEVCWDDKSSSRFDHKSRELIKLVEGELCKEQIVVFFRFDDGVDTAYRAFVERGCPVVRVTGSTPYAERQTAINAFQEGRARVILLQAECGKYGLDLSSSSVAIFYSQGYSFEVWAQCRQRLAHPSKKSPNLLIYLVSEDTIETQILPALKDKKSVGDFYFNKLHENTLHRS